MVSLRVEVAVRGVLLVASFAGLALASLRQDASWLWLLAPGTLLTVVSSAWSVVRDLRH